MAKPANFASAPFVAGIDLDDLKAVNDLTVRDPAQGPGRRPGGQLHLLQHVDRPGRRDRLHEPGRHRPVHVRVVHARPAERRSRPTRTTGSPASRTSTRSRSSRSTTPTARLNALLSGQIDAMAQLPTAQAKAHQDTGDITVLIAPVAPGHDVLHGHHQGAVQRRQRAAGDQADRRPRRRWSTARSTASARSATTSSARACPSTTTTCPSASRTSTRPSPCSRRPARRT